MIVEIATALAAIVLIYLVFNAATQKVSGKKPVPGPSFVQGFIPFLKAIQKNEFHLLGEDLAAKFGNLVEINAGFCKIIYINDADLVRRIMCDPEYKSKSNDRAPSFVGKHIFQYQDIATASYGPNLLKARKLFHSTLKFYGEGADKLKKILQSTIQDFVFRLRDNYTDCNVPLSKELTQYICRLVGTLLIGDSLEESDLPSITHFVDSIDECFFLENDSILQMFPFARYIPGLRIKRIVDDLYSNRKRLLSNFFHKIRHKKDLKGMVADLLNLQQEQKSQGHTEVISDELIMALIQNICAAAYLTTASAVTGLFLHLIKKPDIQERISAEIQTVIGDSVPSLDHRRQMPYTEATILEILRVSTNTPLMIPHFVNDDFEIDGFSVSKGSMLLLNAWTFHHKADHWADPWIFKPDRLLDEDGELFPPGHPVRQRLIPFGVGARSCPAENFARHRLFLLVTSLIQRFRFLPPSGEDLPSESSRDWRPNVVFSPDHFMCRIALRE